MRKILLFLVSSGLMACGNSEDGGSGKTGSDAGGLFDTSPGVEASDTATLPDVTEVDGAAGVSAICEAYIACTAKTTPAGLGTVIATYGEKGTCWATGQAEMCESACKVGVVTVHKAFPGVEECNLCSESADCPPSIRACDSQAGRCVTCLSDSDCPSSDAPACDISTHTCVACLQDHHCDGMTPVCNAAARRCVRCLTDDHCPADAHRCDTSTNQCLECIEDKDCAGSSKGAICLPMVRRCGCGLLGKGCAPSQLCEESVCCTPDCGTAVCGPSHTYGCGSDNPYACGVCPNKGTCNQGACSDLGVECDPKASACYAGERCSFSVKTKDYRCLRDAEDKDCNNIYACHVLAGDEGAYVCTNSRCRPHCLTASDCTSGHCEEWGVPISPSSPGVCTLP
ncbi:MAG TPA: hypothetical protein PLM08_05820 [Polyangiaceae bacterium]|nr:hypothetical protein [Polyangiaceae bacterium]